MSTGTGGLTAFPDLHNFSVLSIGNSFILISVLKKLSFELVILVMY